MLRFFILLFVVIQGVYGQDKMADYRRLLADYQKAADANDITTSLKHLESIDYLRPNSLTVLKLLTQSYLTTGQNEKAEATLERSVWVNTAIVNDPAFVDLATTGSRFRRLADSISRENIISEVVYVLNDSGFHPEGIAFDERRERFIFGSIRTGNLLVCNKDGTTDSRFFKPAAPMACIMGMRIDERSNRLVVATAAMPQYEGYNDSLDGWSAIVTFDLKSGKEIGRVVGPGKHVFGDLVLDRNGSIYVSDSRDPVIYVMRKGSSRLDTLLNVTDAWNLQGLALSPDERYLFVADYISGIHRIDLGSKECRAISPSTKGLRGTDGLYFHANTLVAIQNGVSPRRVLGLHLNEALDVIERVSILDNNLPYKGEPTLGVMVNGYLLYLANAPWHAYDKNGAFLKNKSEATIVRSLRID